MEAIKI